MKSAQQGGHRQLKGAAGHTDLDGAPGYMTVFDDQGSNTVIASSTILTAMMG